MSEKKPKTDLETMREMLKKTGLSFHEEPEATYITLEISQKAEDDACSVWLHFAYDIENLIGCRGFGQ